MPIVDPTDELTLLNSERLASDKARPVEGLKFLLPAPKVVLILAAFAGQLSVETIPKRETMRSRVISPRSTGAVLEIVTDWVLAKVSRAFSVV